MDQFSEQFGFGGYGGRGLLHIKNNFGELIAIVTIMKTVKVMAIFSTRDNLLCKMTSQLKRVN